MLLNSLMAGCTPAPINTGIKIAPTAAEQPPALVIEVFTSAVAITAPGTRNGPNFFRIRARK